MRYSIGEVSLKRRSRSSRSRSSRSSSRSRSSRSRSSRRSISISMRRSRRKYDEPAVD